jgi:hypothetical protein
MRINSLRAVAGNFFKCSHAFCHKKGTLFSGQNERDFITAVAIKNAQFWLQCQEFNSTRN